MSKMMEFGIWNTLHSQQNLPTIIQTSGQHVLPTECEGA